jgi:NitT/TauT family transport system substrate-binding protein
MLALAACTPASLTQPTAAPTAASSPRARVIVGAFGTSATTIPLYAGLEQGFFRQEGIDLEVRELANNIILVQGLLTGDFQVMIDGEAALNAAATGGAPFVFIGSNQKSSPYRLMGAKHVKTFGDLKGSKILVGTKGSSAEFWSQ